MASLSNPTLSIQLISGSSNANCAAAVEVALTQFEQFLISNAGLRVRLRCRLMGADSTLFTGDDDNLFLYPTQTVSTAGRFTFQAVVSRGTLDEDIGGDEVFARFFLRSAEPSFPIDVTANSPEISGRF